MRLKDVQKRLDLFLKYQDPLQNNPDYRLKLFMYNMGDVIKHDVYGIYYGEKSPIKSSLKCFFADALIQILLYARVKGVDIEEVIEMGLDRVTVNKCFEDKK